jgi:acyl carrier protein
VNTQDIARLIAEELGNIAPDADAASVDPDADLRAALDIDSMDFLNLMIALNKRLGVDIPERDYPKLFTMAGATTYLAARLGR